MSTNIISGGAIDEAKNDEMYDNNEIAHNIKASKEQIIDDLNGILSALQLRVMLILLDPLNELYADIIFMKSDEKKAYEAIKDRPGNSRGGYKNPITRYLPVKTIICPKCGTV